MLNSSPSSAAGTSSALEMLTGWKSSWVILNEDQEAFPPFLLSLHHQNNKHAGTDSIGLPPLEIDCYSTSCQKVTDCLQIKGTTGTNFYFLLFTFICHHRPPPPRLLWMSVLNLHCSNSCKNVVQSNIRDGHRMTASVIPAEREKDSIRESAGLTSFAADLPCSRNHNLL